MDQEKELIDKFDFKIQTDDNHDNLNSNYQEILYLCALASNAIYQNDPFFELEKGIFSDLSHSIHRLCVSQ